MTALNPEYVRAGLLVQAVEDMRAGRVPAADFETRFEAAAAAVAEGRITGAWREVAGALPRVLADRFIAVDLDILALLLAAAASPSLAARIAAIEGRSGGGAGLALLQDVLALDEPAEAGLLHDRLSPHAPLVAGGLVRVEADGPVEVAHVTAAACLAALGRSGGLATPAGATLVTRRPEWADLVLSPVTEASLEDLAGWVVARETVFVDWGARPQGGPLALFSGPSGTGKSFAAAAVTAALEVATGEPWALYALDLGAVMSKYVGETEKNLNRLLDALDGRRAVLQIDEADGLLGKRGEVSDARDRYANLEVSHMLGRFEAHQGPVILTTNLRANIDQAFLRRFQLVVDFAAPDIGQRARLWSRLLPPRAPGIEAIDCHALAGAVALTGGQIHNVCIHAAVLAARGEGSIGYREIARAVWAELGKEARAVRPAELGFLAEHVSLREVAA
ncbi:MAG: ATP-binding protein [Pseudomonadota bacterium]